MRGGAQKEARVSGIAVFEKGWPSKKAALYVYAEGAPSLDDELLVQASEQANRQWQHSRLSTTAALQEAAAAGMRSLVEGGGASGAGVTCAVLQDGGVYLAQAGATRAYILGPLVCRRVASSSPWDPNHVDVREETLPAASVLLMSPSVLEEALPLLQGGLPPKEIHRMIKAWLQDRPRLSALVVGIEDGRPVALGVGLGAPAEKVERPAPQPSSANAWVSARKLEPAHSGETAPVAPGEAPFPILRALRLPLIGIAVLLALVVLGGVAWYLPGRQKGEDEARLAGLIETAKRTRQEAVLDPDPSLARVRLGQADALVREAAEMRPKDKRVTALQQEITNDLDRISSVLRPSTVTMLVDLSKEGGPQSSPSRIILDGNNLYVFDRGAGRVYKLILEQGAQSIFNTANRTLIRKGDNHGGSSLADLADAVWMPDGPLRSAASLLTLDSQGLLLDYRPEKGVQVLPLRGVRGWSSFRAANGYSGNLYVLDPAARQVWRYVPTSSGYDSEARGILEDANIADAVDLSIDGNIYILSSRGAVWKFAGGAVQTFSQEKMDRPLAAPAALFTNPSSDYVYVADRGNSRVVAFTKEGKFAFQVRADALEGVQGIFVDERQGRLYFASGQKVFVAGLTIPKP